MPNVSWAQELGLNMTTLEQERPDNWFQKQITQLHKERGEAFAEYRRPRNPEDVIDLQNIAWERYSRLTRIVCDLTGSPIPVCIMIQVAERQANVKRAVLKNTCTRCGFIWNIRQPRFVDGLCSSCLATQQRILQTGRLACQPWQGRFARDDVTPVNASGEPILPGRRLCNNSDCVNPKHITKGRNENG